MMVGLVMVCIGLVSLLFRSSVLMMLLSLEFIMLGVFYSVLVYWGLSTGEGYFILVFLTFMVCEGAMGLGLVVLLTMSYGNDYLSSLSLLEC